MGKNRTYPVGSPGYEHRRATRHKTRRDASGAQLTRFGARRFAAIDGEGGTVWGPVVPDSPAPPGHHYYLLRAGAHELVRGNSAGNDSVPLTTRDILDFMCTRDPDYIYVAFAFGYDVTMTVRDMPAERLSRLMDRKSRTRVLDGKLVTLPLDWEEYQLDYMPGKEFKVRKQLNWSDDRDRSRNTAPVWTPWFIVHDVFSFFQCSFVSALDLWFGSEKDKQYHPAIEQIKKGKDQRAEFTGLNEYIREYCHLECNMLVLLMDRFRDNAYAAGVHPARWQGPGNLVAAVMQREGMVKNKDVPLWHTNIGKGLREAANAAYYGGRFEAPIIGDVPGPIYQADINSAYAAVYRNLPCLMHGRWTALSSNDSDNGNLSIRKYHFHHSNDVFLCGLPVRTAQGTIIFPRRGNGVYWSHEIGAATPYLDRINMGTGYVYEPDCDCSPFDWVYQIYNHRLEVGKKSGQGLIDKLVLASTYGKLCQSVGSAPYANPVWASLITSHIRTQLYMAGMAHDNGRDVIALATDGIFTTNRRTLQYGSGIGEWDLTVHDGMFSIQSGVYLLPDAEPKSRGVSRRLMAEREFDLRACWATALEAGGMRNAQIQVRVHSFNGIGLCVARGKPDEAGQWVDINRAVGFEWANKRNESGWEVVGNTVRTTPINGSIYHDNVPYKETIGGVLMPGVEYPTIERERDSDQPDWNFHNIGYGIRR